MNDKASTLCAILARLVLVAIALVAAAPAHAAGEDWTCHGVQSALCLTRLTAERCVVSDQVCFANGDDLLFNQLNCACAHACDNSAGCGPSEACYKHHCWSNLSCNVTADCPADATCSGGNCHKLGACTSANDCNSGAPDCIDGSCGTLLPGQCTSDSQCSGDPCGGQQRCDLPSHRCTRQGPLPCERIAHARCFATSATAFQCLVPACTSDAQCAAACEGAQKCDLPTGRCIPAQPACNEAAGELCQALSPTAHQCLLTAPHQPWGQVDNSPVITRPDLTLIPEVGVPGGGTGAGRFVLTGSLPASSFAKGAPSAISLVVSTDGTVLVDSTVGAADKTGAWAPDARSGAWRWKAKDPRSPIDRVLIQPGDGKGGELHFEIGGHTLPSGGKVDPASKQYGAEVWLQGAGPAAKPVRSAIAFTECKGEQREGALATVCKGKAAK